MNASRPAVSISCALALAGLLGLVSSCAISVAPSGGPADVTAPTLAAVTPDSGAVGLAPGREIVLEFSEKMEPQPAERFLFTYPPMEIEKTKWQGRIRARVFFEEAFPADTVIVVELAPRLKDNHRVDIKESRRWTFATADYLPHGRIEGRLLQGGEPLAKGLLELYDLPPDTVEYFTQDILRRAVTDSAGRYAFEWLPAPGGPWLIRAVNDANGNLRIDENEGRRLLPDSYSLTAATPTAVIDTVTVYGTRTPGILVGHIDTLSRSADVYAWPLTIAEEDTGWVPEPQKRAPESMTLMTAGQETEIKGAGPGLVRLVFFVDADGDSLPGVLFEAEEDTSGYLQLERMAVLDSLTVEPGMPTRFPVPVFPDTLPRWLPPADWSSESDSLDATADIDSLETSETEKDKPR